MNQTAEPLPVKPATSYRVGTLVYSSRALITVMFWMLLGDFCLQMMEQLPITIVPLQLRWAHASDALIGFLTGSLPAVLGIVLNPFVGVQSDNHRGPLGRRRPFLLWATPLVVIALIGLGFAAQVASGISGLFGLESAESVKIGWIGGCMVVFVVANTYIMQIYQFLFVDVIPAQVMGRFVGCYRAIGAMGTFVFHRFVFGKAETHTTEIYIGTALIYAASFLLLVWQVKEGEYPVRPQKKSFVNHFLGYFRDCFGNAYYWKIYSLSFFFWGAIVPFTTFRVFFGTVPGDATMTYAPTIGLSLGQFGQIIGWFSLIGVPVFFLVGPIVDKFHPIRVAMVGLLLSALAFTGCYFGIHGETSLLVWMLITGVAIAVYMGAYLATLPRLLPRSYYGRFFTANQIFGFSGVVLAPVLCGGLISYFKDYRFLFVWCAACCFASFFMSVQVFRDWKRLGGDEHYHPPGFKEEEQEPV